MSHARGINLSKTRFPELMAARRLEHGWSKAELAQQAGLSAKVIHQIEARTRSVFLEKTLLLVAEALAANLDDLLQPLPEPEAPPSLLATQGESRADAGRSRPLAGRRPRWRLPRRHVVALAAVVLLVAAVPLVRDLFLLPGRTPLLEVGERSVQARHPRSDRLLWSRSFTASVVLAAPSPWADGTVLVGLGFDAPDGGRILLLDGRTGRTRWDRAPDAELAAAAFGVEALAGMAVFSPSLVRPIDLDGDGEAQLAVSFIHVRKYPSSVMILDRGGEVRGEYFNRGHVYDMLAVDLDGDGRQELVCVGASNLEPYRGGTVFVLDRGLARGASVDPINGAGTRISDQSRSRILLPALEPQMMAWLQTQRLSAWRVVSVPSPEGDPRLLVTVGTDRLNMQLLLDADLAPLAVWPNDDVPVAVAGWPVDDPAHYGPNCPLWREQWLQQIVQVTPHDQRHLTRR